MNPLIQSLAGPLNELDLFLEAQVESFDAGIQPLVRDALAGKGKRLRPSLVFASGAGGSPEHAAGLVRFAAVVELIHLATLVHDDILDRAAVRHSLPALYRRYTPAVAVLVGDCLLCQALKLATDFNSPQLCGSIAVATRNLCAGEIKQNFHILSESSTLADYLEIIEQKTAALFQLSCFWGSRLGGHSEAFSCAAGRVGLQLGIAFQGLDDMVDLLGQESYAGKILGTDLYHAKLTLPIWLLLQRLEGTEKKAFLARVAQRSLSMKDLNIWLEQYAVQQAALSFVEDRLSEARRTLAAFADLPSARLLHQACDFLNSEAMRLCQIAAP